MPPWPSFFFCPHSPLWRSHHSQTFTAVRKNPRPLSLPGHPPQFPKLPPIYLMNISTWMSWRYFKHSNLKRNRSLTVSKAITIQLDSTKRNTGKGTGRLSSYGDRELLKGWETALLSFIYKVRESMVLNTTNMTEYFPHDHSKDHYFRSALRN